MWTILNFHGRLTQILVLGASLIVGGLHGGCGGASVSQVPPDAPRSRLPVDEQRPPARGYLQQMVPLELESVSVHRLDSTLVRFAGPAFLKTATDPFAIEVRTQAPLGNLARTSSPVIVLNGEQLTDTWAVGMDTLVAFLRDLSKIKDTNIVAAVWIGNEELTMTRKPLVFKAADVRR